MCELLWSDPGPGNGRTPSKRGVGVAFGADVTQRFLQDNGLDLLVRSHEVLPPPPLPNIRIPHHAIRWPHLQVPCTTVSWVCLLLVFCRVLWRLLAAPVQSLCSLMWFSVG